MEPPATAFSFDDLRRWPDVESRELVAVDATDRLLLDDAAEALATAPAGSVVVIEDRYGAITLGAAALHGQTGLRVHQDARSGRRALEANSARVGLDEAWTSVELDQAGLEGARVVLLQLPRALDSLEETAELIARWAHPEVQVFAGGRLKHMTRSMNEVLGRSFGQVDARLARQKSRVLVASQPQARPEGNVDGAASTAGEPASRWPAREHHADLDLTVCAHGGVFAGTRIDIGTRQLLAHLDAMAPRAERAVDLGCGSGVVAALLARSRPDLHVLATDDSAAAVASARATAAANGLGDRITVTHDDALAQVEDASVDLVVLNPPFHTGTAVHTGVARRLFGEAARVLRPGGELWAVWNSHLMYRPVLERAVGKTRQLSRDPKFTVTASTKA